MKLGIAMRNIGLFMVVLSYVKNIGHLNTRLLENEVLVTNNFKDVFRYKGVLKSQIKVLSNVLMMKKQPLGIIF